MTEAQFSLKLRKELQRRMPEAIIWKIADQFTAGIPDFVVIHHGLATWFELKMYTNKKLFEPIQHTHLKKLERGFYIFWGKDCGVVFHVFESMEETLSKAKTFLNVPFGELVEQIVNVCQLKGVE